MPVHRSLFVVLSVAALVALLSAPACSSNCTRQADGSCAGTASVSTTDGGVTISDGGVSTFEPYGTVPSGGHISLDCSPHQIPAYSDHDCLYSHYQNPETVTCTLKLADRYGVVIGVATPVSFMAEAGVISPVEVSPAYPADPSTLGHATGYLEVFGGPLPADVEPMSGELSVSYDFGCGTRTANPRDGYVTVIAWVKGEEGFVDVNQNGKYDPGEPFLDEGEPYVDANDNGQWDQGEWYLDVNQNGKYDGPNGKWDADTVIWTQTRIVYTGLPAIAVNASGQEELSRLYSLGGTTEPPAPTSPPTPFALPVPPATAFVDFGAFFTDILLNPPDPSATYQATTLNGLASAQMSTPELPLRSPPDLFRLLYCDKPQFPATCHDGPLESGCVTSPCYEVPEVGLCLTDNCSGFQYGSTGTVKVGPCDASGTETVLVSATVANAVTTFPVSGSCGP